MSQRSSGPEIGAVVSGRFRLDAVLGEGGMGRVYRARDLGAGADVALKVLRRDLGRLALRVEEEARAIRRIDHPGVVRLVASGVGEDGSPWVAMELVHGPDLRQVLKREGPLPEARAVRIGDEILDALGAAHRAGVVHGDPKPENVLLADEPGGVERIKIVDFGVARIAAEAPGVTAGTPRYLPPEILAGAPADERSDIYAVGLVLLELVTGQLEPATSALRPSLQRAIGLATAADPSARPANAEALRALLRAADLDRRMELARLGPLPPARR